MNAAIITKSIGQVKDKIKATCQAGSITVKCDNKLNAPDNHRQAAMQLAIKVGWEGTYYGGGMPDQTGYCFVQSLSVYTDNGQYRENPIGNAFDATDMLEWKEANPRLIPLWFIEITDVFGGEANYSWVTRHVIQAKSKLAAIQWLAKDTGLNWRFDGMRYNSLSGATCAFIDEYDRQSHSEYRLSTDQRNEGE